MRGALICLTIAYVLSQFFRAFLAVLTPVLGQELGLSHDDLSQASGLWFICFALAQFPVGWMLDHFGPRLTTVIPLGLCAGGGALLFALAQNGLHIKIAMGLIGVGCAPVLMAGYYLFANNFPVVMFGTLAGMVTGFGSLGNIFSAWPLERVVAFWGWRETLAVIAVLTVLVAVFLLFLLPKQAAHADQKKQGSLRDIFTDIAVWPIFVLIGVHQIPLASLRGMWIGPYFKDVYGADSLLIGYATLAMGLAMVAGNFIYGPLERLFRSRKYVILWGNCIVLACLALLTLYPAPGVWQSVMLMVVIGICGASFPLIMAHGRAFFPPHLMGRGVTLLNFFCIAPIGIAQVFVTPHLHHMAGSVPAERPYIVLFSFFAGLLAVGCAVYALWATERTD